MVREGRREELSYPIEMIVMWRDEAQLKITLSHNRIIDSKLLINEPVIWVPRDIYPDRISYRSFKEFICSRLPDKNRDDIEYILEQYDLKEYEPIKMCMKSHGRNMTDFLWILFNDEELMFDDVRLR